MFHSKFKRQRVKRIPETWINSVSTHLCKKQLNLKINVKIKIIGKVKIRRMEEFINS